MEPNQGEQVHLRDYVWMKHRVNDVPPKQVSTAGDEISRHMWEGWEQIDEPKPVPIPVAKPIAPAIPKPEPTEDANGGKQ